MAGRPKNGECRSVRCVMWIVRDLEIIRNAVASRRIVELYEMEITVNWS